MPLTQVVASLLVSVMLLGFKLSALKSLVQVTQRRTELRVALASLQPRLEEEDLAGFLDDIDHDKEQREVRIGELALASGRVYSTVENEAVERCLGMFDVFDSSSTASGAQPGNSAANTKSEIKYDAATGLTFGRAEAEIRADVLELVADTLNVDSRRFRNAPDPALVRFELLATVNAHHSIAFWRCKAKGFRIADKTFLMSVIAKRLAKTPRTYAVAAVPIPSHAKLRREDEVGAVRAENCRSFRFTEVAPGVTKMEFCSSFRLPRWSPPSFTSTVAAHKESVPQDVMLYFQQIRPLSECEEEDGVVVGCLLLDLVTRNPKELAPTIRQFVLRTAMLRECGFCHIGEMLCRVLIPDAQIPSGLAHATRPAIRVHDPSLLTETQAVAIGSAIVTGVRQCPLLATALQKVVRSHTVLRIMKGRHVWFVPMLTVVAGHKALTEEPRRSTLMRRLSSIAVAVVPNANAKLNADESNEESGFRPVVRRTPFWGCNVIFGGAVSPKAACCAASS
jgi:hypothetical protein